MQRLSSFWSENTDGVYLLDPCKDHIIVEDTRHIILLSMCISWSSAKKSLLHIPSTLVGMNIFATKTPLFLTKMTYLRRLNSDSDN